MLGHGEQRTAPVGLGFDRNQTHDFVVAPQGDSSNPRRVTAHGSHVAFLETDRHPVAGGEDHLARAAGQRRGQQGVPLPNPDGPQPPHPDIAVLREGRPLDLPAPGRGEEVEGLRGLVFLGNRHDGDHLALLREAEQVDDGATRACLSGLRNLVPLEPVREAFVGQEQETAMGVADQDILDRVSGANAGPGMSGPAPGLGAVVAERGPLDVSRLGHRDHDVLDGDQLLDGEIARVLDDLGAPVVAMFPGRRLRLVPDDPVHPLGTLQEIAEIVDLLAEFRHLGFDPLPLHLGQALEAEVQNRLGLRFGKAFPVRLRPSVAGPGQEFAVRAETARLEFAHQPRPGARRILRAPDPLDDFVEAVHRRGEPLENVHALLGPVELEAGSPANDVPAELEELAQHSEEREQARPVLGDRQEVHPERRLERGMAVQVVQHHLGLLAALQLHDDPHPPPVRLVAEVRNPGEALVLDEVGDLLDEAGLVDLVGDLGDDDAVPPFAGGLEIGDRPDLNDPAALVVGAHDAAPPVDPAPRREIGSGYQLQQLSVQVFVAGAAVLDQVDQRRGHFAQVVRGDLGRHPDRDPIRAVHQQVRHDRGQHLGLDRLAVEVGMEADRAPVDVLHHGDGNLGEPRLGVAVGGRRIPVHRSEVALPVDQRVPQVESLSEADERVVHRGVTVGVVLLEDLADDSRALRKRTRGQQPLPEHRVQDPALHRFQAVADVRQRPADDHRHRVVHVGLRHLGLDVLDLLLRNRPQRTGAAGTVPRAGGIGERSFRHPGWRRSGRSSR